MVVAVYQSVHVSIVGVLETISTYGIELEDGDASSWVHDASLFVKANSEAIAMWAEVVFALLALEHVVTSAMTGSRNRQYQKPLKVKPGTPGSLLRKALPVQ